jgi:hypothetical protein
MSCILIPLKLSTGGVQLSIDGPMPSGRTGSSSRALSNKLSGIAWAHTCQNWQLEDETKTASLKGRRNRRKL